MKASDDTAKPQANASALTLADLGLYSAFSARSHESRGAMGNRLYVGNLSFNTTQEAIEAAFATAGDVLEVVVPTDAETGQSVASPS
jgi:hypothetical protein